MIMTAKCALVRVTTAISATTIVLAACCVVPMAMGFSSSSSSPLLQPAAWTSGSSYCRARCCFQKASSATHSSSSSSWVRLAMFSQPGDGSSDTNNNNNNNKDESFATSTTIRTVPDGEVATTASSTEDADDDDKDDSNSILDNFQSMFNSIDVASLPKLDTLRENVMSGELGSRGELYFVTQVFLVLCILLGGIPVVGETLNVLLGPGLLLTGLGVLIVATTDLGDALSPWPVPVQRSTTSGDKDDGLLKTDGLYGQFRHPMYAGLLAACAGFSIVTGSANRLLLTAILAYALEIKANYEEQAMIDKYGEAYVQYQQVVPGKFVPTLLLNNLPWTADAKEQQDNNTSEEEGAAEKEEEAK